MKWFLLVITTLQFTNSWSQQIKLGIIDFYGNRKVSEAQLRQKLLFHEGDSIGYELVALRKDSSVQQLKTIPGVKNAALDLICCDDNRGQYMLFVGIDEGNQPPVTYRLAPDSPYVLPKAIMEHYHLFGEAVESAVVRGASGENHDKGHALSQDSGVRIWQYKFIDDANKNFQLLQKVLYYAQDPEQRAAAAHIIAYANDKKKLVAPLLYGVSDPDDGVRNNATRALGVLGVYAQLNPKQGIVIPADPFIKLINSVTWTDRNKGAMVLMSLSQSRDKKLLDRLKNEALPSLIEMAKWKNTGHAYSSLMILGRMAGFKDDDILRAVAEGDKDAMLYKILDKL